MTRSKLSQDQLEAICDNMIVRITATVITVTTRIVREGGCDDATAAKVGLDAIVHSLASVATTLRAAGAVISDDLIAAKLTDAFAVPAEHRGLNTATGEVSAPIQHH